MNKQLSEIIYWQFSRMFAHHEYGIKAKCLLLGLLKIYIVVSIRTLRAYTA